MKNLNTIDWVAFVLLVIGGLNWGMIGVFNVDLVRSIFGNMTMITRAVYVLVGVSALYSAYALLTKTE
jgi:uncharacterized protein